jgi:predicted transcriptional regulator
VSEDRRNIVSGNCSDEQLTNDVFSGPCSGDGSNNCGNVAGLSFQSDSFEHTCCPTASRTEGVVNTKKNDPHLTTKIVSSYVRHHSVAAGQLPDLIATVHRAIGQVGQPVAAEEVLVPAVSVRRSVHQDYVVCLDCGYRGKTLRRHISTRHGFSRDEYLRRWGLRSDHPLTAPAYSERRSTLAKAFGLGRKSTAEVTPAVTPTAPAPVDADQGSEATPARRRRSRSTSKSADVTNEAIAAMPARTRRSRSRVASQQPERTPLPTAKT